MHGSATFRRARVLSVGGARSWLPVAGIALLGLAAAVAYSRLTPIGYGPDEPSHWNYIQLVLHGSLPGGDVAEKQQPPLFYLLGAAVARLGGDLSAVRLLSSAFGVATVVLAALAARELWPASPLRWALVAAVPALLPEAQWLAGTVSDDSLSFAAGAALTLLTVMTFTRRPSARLVLLTGLVIGVALLTKETAYSLVAVLVVCVVVRWGAALRSPAGAVAVLTTFVIAGWWFARNLLSFNSPLPPLRPVQHPGIATAYLTVSLLPQWIGSTAQNLVGNFITFDFVRERTASAWRVALHTLDRVFAAVAAVCAITGLVTWRTWCGAHRGLVVALGASIVLPLLLMVASSVLVDYQPQGRYLLVAAPAGALLAVGGGARMMAALSPILRRLAAIGALAAVVALNVTAFITLHLLSTSAS